MEPRDLYWNNYFREFWCCWLKDHHLTDTACRVQIPWQLSAQENWLQCMDTKGERGLGGMNWEVGIDIYTILILCIKHITSENLGEGNDNPLQYSCLENPRDGGSWWAAIYGVAQSRTWLKRLSSSENLLYSTGNSIQCSVIAWMGRKKQKKTKKTGYMYRGA